VQGWNLHFRTDMGYGGGYNNTSELPFYEHFFAGGFGSVRGFKTNTLGPRSTEPELYVVSQPVTQIDEDGNPTEEGGPGGGQFGYVYDPGLGKLVSEPVPNRNKANPFGGNVKIVGTAELIFPLPFIKDRSQVRSAFFIDAGNVFSTHCGTSQPNCSDVDFGEFRYSIGVGLTWITGFGPMTFSLAKPINTQPADREEVFQFTLGRGF
jgi:outer membrane protein insertion porin family